jgi:AcrR family transcriptional regulator
MEYGKRLHAVQQDLRREIIANARDLFIENGITPVKMTDIAERSGVGVASLYRWFGTKKELAIEVGISTWEMVGAYLDGVFTSPVYLEKSGRERCGDLLKLFYAAYTGHPEMLRYLRDFDIFIQREGVSPEELVDYERSILDLQTPAREAYAVGLADGSIRPMDFDTYYYTATHALMALAQKLVCAGGLVASDSAVSGENQLLALIDIFTAYLKPQRQEEEL